MRTEGGREDDTNPYYFNIFQKKFLSQYLRELFVVVDLVSYSNVDLTMLGMMDRCPGIVPNIILDLCQVFSHVYSSGARRFVYIVAVIYVRRAVY